MKIIINALPIRSPLTGVGNYTYNLITQFQRLRPDFDYTYYYGYFARKLKFYPDKGKSFYYSLDRSPVPQERVSHPNARPLPSRPRRKAREQFFYFLIHLNQLTSLLNFILDFALIHRIIYHKD